MTTKCNFCRYFVGNECVAVKANGQVSEYYCRDAIWEFNRWKKEQEFKKNKNKRYYR